MPRRRAHRASRRLSPGKSTVSNTSGGASRNRASVSAHSRHHVGNDATTAANPTTACSTIERSRSAPAAASAGPP